MLYKAHNITAEVTEELQGPIRMAKVTGVRLRSQEFGSGPMRMAFVFVTRVPVKLMSQVMDEVTRGRLRSQKRC